MIPAVALQPVPAPAPRATPWPEAPGGIRHLALVEAGVQAQLLAVAPGPERRRRWRAARAQGLALLLPQAEATLSVATTAVPTALGRSPLSERQHRLVAELPLSAHARAVAAALAAPHRRWCPWLITSEVNDGLATTTAAPAAVATGLNLDAAHGGRLQLALTWPEAAPLDVQPAPVHLLPGAPVPQVLWGALPSAGLRRGQALSLPLPVALPGFDEWPTVRAAPTAGLSARVRYADMGPQLELSTTPGGPLGLRQLALTAEAEGTPVKVTLSVIVTAF